MYLGVQLVKVECVWFHDNVSHTKGKKQLQSFTCSCVDVIPKVEVVVVVESGSEILSFVYYEEE